MQIPATRMNLFFALAISYISSVCHELLLLSIRNDMRPLSDWKSNRSGVGLKASELCQAPLLCEILACQHKLITTVLWQRDSCLATTRGYNKCHPEHVELKYSPQLSLDHDQATVLRHGVVGGVYSELVALYCCYPTRDRFDYGSRLQLCMKTSPSPMTPGAGENTKLLVRLMQVAV